MSLPSNIVRALYQYAKLTNQSVESLGSNEVARVVTRESNLPAGSTQDLIEQAISFVVDRKGINKSISNSTAMVAESSALAENTQVQEAKGLNKKVKIVRGPADTIGKIGHVVEIRRGLYKGAPKELTIEYTDDNGRTASVQLPVSSVRIVKDEPTAGLAEDDTLQVSISPEIAAKLRAVANKKVHPNNIERFMTSALEFLQKNPRSLWQHGVAALVSHFAGAAVNESGVSRIMRFGTRPLSESTIDSPVYNALVDRITTRRIDLLRDYGLDAVAQACEDAASFYDDVSELGTSDIGHMMREVEAQLKRRAASA